MYVQIIGFTIEEHAINERQTLCDHCAAICNRLAGVQAHQWSFNPVTNTVTGIVKWTEYEAIAMGTETLQTEVAFLQSANRVLRCREIACAAKQSPAAHDMGREPNTGFVRYPPGYDPRG